MGKMGKSGLTIPAGAIGRPGLIASVRRMSNVPEGRLVALLGPAGWVRALSDSEQPVFAWNVHLLGDPVPMAGITTRGIVVPDGCLVPLGDLPQRQIEAVMKAHALADFNAASADLAALIQGRDISPEMLEREIGRAAEVVWIRHALEEVPVWQALQDMGFEPYPNSEVLRWQRVHRGEELKITAGPDMFGRCLLMGSARTARAIFCDEQVLAERGPRGAYAKRLADIWRDVFPGAPMPAAFELGELYARHRKDMRCAAEEAATLRVDGEMLRAARRVLKARCGYMGEWRVCISYGEGTLRLKVGEFEFGCPATGLWVDDCEIALGDFLALPWMAFRGTEVAVRREGEVILFGGTVCAVAHGRHGFPAT